MADHIYVLNQLSNTIGNRDSTDVRQLMTDTQGRLYPFSLLGNINDEADKFRAVSVGNSRYLSSVIQHITSNAEDTTTTVEALGKVVLPAGDRYVIRNYLGGGLSIYTGTLYSVACSEDMKCMTFDIFVSNAKGEVINSILGVKAGDKVFGAGKLIAPNYPVASDDILFMDIAFTQLPFKDANGNMRFFDDCNPPPCFNINVHHYFEDNCFSDIFSAGGCGGGCCITRADMKCKCNTLEPLCPPSPELPVPCGQ